jgi:hypothetical protein
VNIQTEAVGYWRKLCNEELFKLYSGVEVREFEIGGALSMHGKYEKSCRIMVANSEGLEVLGFDGTKGGSKMIIITLSLL